MEIQTDIPLLNEILDPWKAVIGNDFQGYKNHIIRMLNFCFYLADPTEEERRKLIIAAAHHDIGIWSGPEITADYLPPSLIESRKYLEKNGLSDWTEEIDLIIDQHHKIRQFKSDKYRLVELFRRADLVDFSLGLFKKGVPKSFVVQVRETIPNAGFHKLLLKLTWMQLEKNPFNPAPMMKW